jgi:hydroxymethylpyrimidine pyrophosphatase-like HAD family hydrolase
VPQELEPASVSSGTLPDMLQRPFAIVAFDWDGTAVADRRDDASDLRTQLLALATTQGLTFVVVTGTHVQNVLDQLASDGSRLPPRRLYVAANRGSEVFEIGPDWEPIPIWRRSATPEEDAKSTQ